VRWSPFLCSAKAVPLFVSAPSIVYVVMSKKRYLDHQILSLWAVPGLDLPGLGIAATVPLFSLLSRDKRGPGSFPTALSGDRTKVIVVFVPPPRHRAGNDDDEVAFPPLSATLPQAMPFSVRLHCVVFLELHAADPHLLDGSAHFVPSA